MDALSVFTKSATSRLTPDGRQAIAYFERHALCKKVKPSWLGRRAREFQIVFGNLNGKEKGARTVSLPSRLFLPLKFSSFSCFRTFVFS
jgi:hypothetical protein